MNAIQFIKEHSVEKAREVVDGAPVCSTAFNVVSCSIIYYQLCDNWWWYNSARKEYEMDYSKSMKIGISDLKRLIDSIERINGCGGLHGFKTYCNRDFSQEDLQAIADYEEIFEVSIFKTGEQVVMSDADDYDSIFTVVGQPLRMYQLQGSDDLFYGRLSIQIRHATAEEIAAGHRIDHFEHVLAMEEK